MARIATSSRPRRPAPGPAAIDARLPVAVGTVLWALAAVAAAIWSTPLAEAGRGWFGAAAIVGIAIGVIGLVVLQLRRARSR